MKAKRNRINEMYGRMYLDNVLSEQTGPVPEPQQVDNPVVGPEINYDRFEGPKQDYIRTVTPDEYKNMEKINRRNREKTGKLFGGSGFLGIGRKKHDIGSENAVAYRRMKYMDENPELVQANLDAGLDIYDSNTLVDNEGFFRGPEGNQSPISVKGVGHRGIGEIPGTDLSAMDFLPPSQNTGIGPVTNYGTGTPGNPEGPGVYHYGRADMEHGVTGTAGFTPTGRNMPTSDDSHKGRKLVYDKKTGAYIEKEKRDGILGFLGGHKKTGNIYVDDQVRGRGGASTNVPQGGFTTPGGYNPGGHQQDVSNYIPQDPRKPLIHGPTIEPGMHGFKDYDKGTTGEYNKNSYPSPYISDGINYNNRRNTMSRRLREMYSRYRLDEQWTPDEGWEQKTHDGWDLQGTHDDNLAVAQFRSGQISPDDYNYDKAKAMSDYYPADFDTSPEAIRGYEDAAYTQYHGSIYTPGAPNHYNYRATDAEGGSDEIGVGYDQGRYTHMLSNFDAHPIFGGEEVRVDSRTDYSDPEVINWISQTYGDDVFDAGGIPIPDDFDWRGGSAFDDKGMPSQDYIDTTHVDALANFSGPKSPDELFYNNPESEFYKGPENTNESYSYNPDIFNPLW